MAIVSPSILSADFGKLGADCRMVLDAGAQMLHYDVMDGQHRAAVRAQLAKISRKDRRTYNRHSISLRSVIFKSFYPHRPGIFPVLRFPEYRGMDIFSLHENAQKIKPAGLFFTEKS